MALTSAQKASIRLYLGYSDMSRQSAGHVNLDGAMVGLSSDAETIVGTLLTSLATVDTSLGTVESSDRAGIKSVDNGGVVWADSGQSASINIERRGRRLVARLASVLGVPVLSDMFAPATRTSGPAGRG